MNIRYTDYWFRRGRVHFLDNVIMDGMSTGYDGNFDAGGEFDVGKGSADSDVVGRIMDTPLTIATHSYTFPPTGYTDFVFTGWCFYAIYNGAVDYIDMNGGIYRMKNDYGVTYESICYDGLYFYLLTSNGMIIQCDALFNTVSEFAETDVNATTIRALMGTVYKYTNGEIRAHIEGGDSINVMTIAGIDTFEVTLAGFFLNDNTAVNAFDLTGDHDFKWSLDLPIIGSSRAITHNPLTDTLLILKSDGLIYNLT